MLLKNMNFVSFVSITKIGKTEKHSDDELHIKNWGAAIVDKVKITFESLDIRLTFLHLEIQMQCAFWIQQMYEVKNTNFFIWPSSLSPLLPKFCADLDSSNLDEVAQEFYVLAQLQPLVTIQWFILIKGSHSPPLNPLCGILHPLSTGKLLRSSW